MKIVFSSFLAMIAGFYPVSAISADKPPVVLELFTSQSCSSCPPADKILGEWAEQPNVIALSCNVTYWNHLHWKDTLSREFCTQRQREYNAAFGRNDVYTPQLVVNGYKELVGSRGSQVTSAIKNAAPVKPIDIKKDADTLDITLPDLTRGNYNIVLFAHGDAHTPSIPSGENRGRSVNYTNPVQDYIALGKWDGKAQEISFNTNNLEKAAGYVVLVQEKSAVGTIKAAGQIRL